MPPRPPRRRSTRQRSVREECPCISERGPNECYVTKFRQQLSEGCKRAKNANVLQQDGIRAGRKWYRKCSGQESNCSGPEEDDLTLGLHRETVEELQEHIGEVLSAQDPTLEEQLAACHRELEVYKGLKTKPKPKDEKVISWLSSIGIAAWLLLRSLKILLLGDS